MKLIKTPTSAAPRFARGLPKLSMLWFLFIMPAVSIAASTPQHACLIATADQDIFSGLNQSFMNLAANTSVGMFCAILRVATILIISTIICGATFRNAPPNLPREALIAIQWAAFLLSSFLVFQLPLARIPLTPGSKGFILAACICAIAVLPLRLSWLLVPIEKTRKSLAIYAYGLIAALLVVQLFFA